MPPAAYAVKDRELASPGFFQAGLPRAPGNAEGIMTSLALFKPTFV